MMRPMKLAGSQLLFGDGCLAHLKTLPYQRVLIVIGGASMITAQEMGVQPNEARLMLGNEAIAQGAWEAGVRVVSSYPGTPSTEITEALAKYSEVNVQWAPNEKVAAEVAFGASMAGARAMTCMKHVGVNVAADPIFTAAYTGVNGGMVICCADDPAMHSSQNEQDSRYYARAAHLPMLEPSDSQECKDFAKLAFQLSEELDTPVFVRLTTRIAHGSHLHFYASTITSPSKPQNINPCNEVTFIPRKSAGLICKVSSTQVVMPSLSNPPTQLEMRYSPVEVSL